MEEGTHSRTSLPDRGYVMESDVYIPHSHCNLHEEGIKHKKGGPLEVILLRAYKKEGKESREHLTLKRQQPGPRRHLPLGPKYHSDVAGS